MDRDQELAKTVAAVRTGPAVALDVLVETPLVGHGERDVRCGDVLVHRRADRFGVGHAAASQVRQQRRCVRRACAGTAVHVVRVDLEGERCHQAAGLVVPVLGWREVLAVLWGSAIQQGADAACVDHLLGARVVGAVEEDAHAGTSAGWKCT